MMDEIIKLRDDASSLKERIMERIDRIELMIKELKELQDVKAKAAG